MGDVGMLTVTGLLSQLVGFLYRVLLSRLAGAEVLGLYQLILPVYSVLLSLTSAGLTTAVCNLSARYQALDQLRVIHQLRGQAVRLFFALVLLPCGVLLACSDGASVYLLGDARTQLGLLLLLPCLLLTGVENLQKHFFYGTGRIFPAAVTELLEHLLRSALVLGLLWRYLPQSPERTVGLIVLGMALCEVCAAATQTILFRIYLGSPRTLKGGPMPVKLLRRQIGQIALPIGLTALLGNLLSSVNAVLLPRLLVQGGMGQSQAVSAFGVVFGMTLPMLLLPTAFLNAVGLVLTPRLAQCAALGQRQEIRRQVGRAASAVNLVLFPAFALLAVLGPRVGGILYREPEVGRYLPLLAAGVLFSCWHALLDGVLSGLGRQAAAAGIALVCDGVQLGLTCLTVSRWGLGAYALLFTATALLGAGLCWPVVARETGLTLAVCQWILPPFLSSCLAAACAYLIRTILEQSGLGSLPAAGGALLFGLVFYLAGLQATGMGSQVSR